MPLRSKHAREILPHVQGVVNKLEATGFPVQRYHADRAQELRSAALVTWLKGQGIHPTWTAGESPAGNRAELAVQQLKAFVRKLLFVAELDKGYWPLALMHASARNWLTFCESLGVPQVPMLPFGLGVHARRRTRTGYQAQWESRTVEGRYLGHAPSTPGGHLVLVPSDPPGDMKVLLTNTVYPLSAGSEKDCKPRYRLRGKRSAPFAVRVVAAHDVSFWRCDFTRCSPGGESSYEPFFLDNSGLVHSGTSGSSVACLGLGTSEEGEPEVSTDSCEERFSLEELGGGFGVCWEMPNSFEEMLAVVGSGECLDAKLDSGRLEGASQEWIQDLLARQAFSDSDCLEVLERGLEVLPVTRRPLGRKSGRAVLLGLYGVGGFRGITKATGVYSEVVKYLNEFLKTQCLEHVWTTLYVTKNAALPIHRDLRNAEGSRVCVRAFGNFVGGGLWVEDEQNCGPVGKLLPSGDRRFGSVFDAKSGPVVFSGKRWHVAEEWEGEVRWVISAFTPRDINGTTQDQWSELSELGFPVREIQAKLEEEAALKVTIEPESSLPECVEWSVGLPIPIKDEVVHEGLERWHDAESRLCRMLGLDLCWACEGTDWDADRPRQLCYSEQLCSWLEGCLSRDHPSEIVVKALQKEIPLSTGEAHEDQFLQTRTVGLPEARKELDKWKDPALEEVSSLEEVNKAVDRVSVTEVDRWADEGINIVQLPGKVVLTRKSGTGKRRCRAVCCGNYLPTDKLGLTREDLYASGAESLSVKIALIFAARHRTWTGVTIDVKSAFLYAPIRSDTKARKSASL